MKKKLKPIILSVSIGKTTYYPSPAAQEEIDGLHDKIGPGRATHDELRKIVVDLPSDFEPYGKRKREGHPIALAAATSITLLKVHREPIGASARIPRVQE